VAILRLLDQGQGRVPEFLAKSQLLEQVVCLREGVDVLLHDTNSKLPRGSEPRDKNWVGSP
jgi:hypothetical protein